MKIHLDTTSNAIKNPEVKKQIEDSLREDFEKELPEVIKRMEEVLSFLTHEVGIYSKLLREAKRCYEEGLYCSSLAMIGITAERFCLELSENINFKINDNEISEEDLFNRPIKSQWLRLSLLEKAKIIKPEIYEKLKEIDTIRNKYIHPREEGDAKSDALKVLNLFIWVLNSRFSEKYIIIDGKIVARK